jgi:hypothetical protein
VLNLILPEETPDSEKELEEVEMIDEAHVEKHEKV